MKLLHGSFVCFASVISSFSVGYAAEEAIPLYTHNFTRINDHCAGDYVLAEHINGRLLNNDHFPICPSRAFNNGSLKHGGGYRIQNLYISKPGEDVALFSSVDNVDIDLIFEKPGVEGVNAAIIAHTVLSNNRIKATFYKGGYVEGYPNGQGQGGQAAMLAFTVTGDNNHIVHAGGDNELQTVEAVSRSAGTVVEMTGSNNHVEQRRGSISVKATGIKGVTAAGIATTLEGDCSDNSLIQGGSHIKVSGNLAAGAVERIACPYTVVSQVQCQVEVTGTNGAVGGFSTLRSSGYDNVLVQIGNRISVDTIEPDGYATGGLRISEAVANTTLIQIANQMNITGTPATSAFLVSDTGTGADSQGTQLLLYSGSPGDNKNTPACPESTGIPVSGLIDIAGYKIDAESCPSQVMRLNSTQPDDWHQLKQIYCEDAGCPENTSCHYPGEQLQTVAPAGNSSLWLVTRQSYPSNPDSDRISPVRISHILINDTSTSNGAIPDGGLSLEGIWVLTPSPFNTEPLPDTPPVARIANQDRLSLLYTGPGNKGALLANFPLSDGDGGHYDTHVIPGLSGQPVLFSKGAEEDIGYLWMREQDGTSDTLRRYSLNVTNPDPVPDTEYNLTMTNYPDAPVVGLGADSHWVYVIRHQGSDALVERIDQVTAQLDNRSAKRENVSVAVNTTGLSFRAYFTSAPYRVVKVKLPLSGGCGQWSTRLPRPIMPYEFTPLPSP